MEFFNEPLIAKEEISKLHFNRSEVLKTDDAIRKRKADLYRAMILGNAYHAKVKIEFSSREGKSCVETTVWHTSDADIALKGGAIIPVCCISNVSF
ncbi:MAG: hypothetical protein ACXWDO_09625 [Bacteroidia bacterium]